MRLKTLHLNTPRSEINSDPNTPLNAKLHYDMMMQTDAIDLNTQNMLHTININQIQHHNHASNIRTQIHEPNYQYP